MLDSSQILTLAEIGKMKVRCCDGIPIAVSCVSDKNIKYPYNSSNSIYFSPPVFLSNAWCTDAQSLSIGGCGFDRYAFPWLDFWQCCL